MNLKMNRIRRPRGALLVAALALLSAQPAWAGSVPRADPLSFHAFLESWWSDWLRLNPALALTVGDYSSEERITTPVGQMMSFAVYAPTPCPPGNRARENPVLAPCRDAPCGYLRRRPYATHGRFSQENRNCHPTCVPAPVRLPAHRVSPARPTNGRARANPGWQRPLLVLRSLPHHHGYDCGADSRAGVGGSTTYHRATGRRSRIRPLQRHLARIPGSRP